MVAATLILGSTLTLLAGLLYAAAGVRFARRARLAGHAVALYSLFWFGLAFFGLTDGAWSLAVPLADPPLAVGVAILHLKTLVGAAAFLGLVHYLLYVYTGSRRILAPLVAFYAVVYAVVAWSYVVAQPVGQEARAWRSGLVYANPGTAWDVAASLLLFVPPLLAAIAYAGLLRHAGEPAQRRRVVATSLAFAAFFGGLLVGWLLEPAWWPPVEKALAIATAALVLWAHREDAQPVA